MISKRALTTLPIVMAFASVIVGSGPQNALAMCVRPDSFEAMVAGGPHSAPTKFYDSIFIARVTGIRSDIQAGSPSSKTMIYEPATYDAVDMQLQERLLGSIPEHPTVMSRQGMEDSFVGKPGTTYVVAGHRNVDGTFVTASCMSKAIDPAGARLLQGLADPGSVHSAPDAIVGSVSSNHSMALEVLGVLLISVLAVAVQQRARARG